MPLSSLPIFHIWLLRQFSSFKLTRQTYPWGKSLGIQPVPRSYHVQDNDWTPLSQNPCWKATISPLFVFTRSDRLRPNTILSRLSGTESDKSFVDDFDMERGIVRVRVGLSYDPLRLSPCSLICKKIQIVDLFLVKQMIMSHSPPTTNKTNQNKTK